MVVKRALDPVASGVGRRRLVHLVSGPIVKIGHGITVALCVIIRDLGDMVNCVGMIT